MNRCTGIVMHVVRMNGMITIVRAIHRRRCLMWIWSVVGVGLQSIEVRLMFFLLLVEQYFRFMKRDWVTRQYVTTCRINF